MTFLIFEHLGHAKLLEFTQLINSLFPTIKFTLVHFPTSVDDLDLPLSLVDGYIQTRIYTVSPQTTMYICYVIVLTLSIAPNPSRVK